jgi:dipeptidase
VIKKKFPIFVAQTNVNQSDKTMQRLSFPFTLFFVFLFAGMQGPSRACTSVLVSAGASADGSVMTSWTYDVAGFMTPLYFYPGGQHEPGDSLDLYGYRDKQYLGRVAQPRRTWKVVGNMNEHQVSIAETTFTGRRELHGGEGVFDYGNLIWTTLQRARTAREAILIMDELAREYGYRDTGESFSIADKHEAWILDFIGKGTHGPGAVWVAARVPEGYIAAHANQSRIRQVDWSDNDHWMWAEDVVDFAREMGWFDGRREEFSFADAYAPPTPRSLLLCESRVWSIFRRAAPSKGFSADYWRCVEGAEPYPLFVKPDEKISVEAMIAFHRDHFHDTPYYTGQGIGAGPFNNPYRWRPVVFQLDGDETSYSWERPISQPQTAFSFITQARSWLPDALGGIVWYGLDDNYSNAFMPLYQGMHTMPPSLTRGNPIEFDWDSSYWVFSLVANYAYGLYSHRIQDIQQVQQEVERRAHVMVPAVDMAARTLYETDPGIMADYLTDFSLNFAENTVEAWRQLGQKLFVKYNDGYIRETESLTPWPGVLGYPQEFLRRAVDERPGYYDVRWRQPGEPVD